jgi:hypothetical protein
MLGPSLINRQELIQDRFQSVDMASGINNEQYPDERLHLEAAHRVLCSTESLFLSDFTPTYSGDNSTTQTFDKLCSRYLEYRELGSSTGWLTDLRSSSNCSRLTHAERSEERRMSQLLLEESLSQLPNLFVHKQLAFCRRHSFPIHEEADDLALHKMGRPSASDNWNVVFKSECAPRIRMGSVNQNAFIQHHI